MGVIKRMQQMVLYIKDRYGHKARKGGRMKRIYLLLFLVTGVLCGCTTHTKSNLEKAVYVSELMFSEELSEADFECGWIDGFSFVTLSSTAIVQYDFSTGQISRTEIEMTDRSPMPGTRGIWGDDGKFHAICIKETEQNTEYYVCLFDENGKFTGETGITDLLRPIMSKGEQQTVSALPNGNIIAFYYDIDRKTSMQVLISEKGEIIDKKELFNTRVVDWYINGSGLWVYDLHLMNDKGEIQGSVSEIDTFTGEWKTLAENFEGQGFKAFTGVENNNVIYYKGNTGIRKHQLDDNSDTELLTYEDQAINPMDVGYVIVLPDENIGMLYGQRTEEDHNVAIKFLLFQKVEKGEGHSEASELTELTLAVFAPKEIYMDDVYAFNKSNKDIKILIREYENGDKFLADVIAGNIPDLVDVGVCDQSVFAALTEKGILAGLDEYLSKDDDLKEDDIFPRSLQCYARDGKLYAVPYGFKVSAMIGDSSYLGNIETWTISDFKQFLFSLPDAGKVRDGVTQQDMLYCLCTAYFSDLVNQENGTCDFQNERFYDILECASMFSDRELRFDDVEDIQEFDNKVRGGEIILYPLQIYSVTSYLMERSLFENQGRIIGFPTESGSGFLLEPYGMAIAMSNNCGHKAKAWTFIRQVLSTRKQRLEESAFMSYIPFFNEAQKEEQREALKNKYDLAAEFEMFKKILDTGKITLQTDDRILGIIQEEAAAYFCGDKTAEEVAKTVQNRIALYMSETRE